MPVVITMGIDVGNLLTKVVVLDGDRLVASGVVETTGNVAGEIHGLVASVLSERGPRACSRSKPARARAAAPTCSKDVDFVEDEVTCVAAAAGYLLPEINMVVDIGGQSITAMLLDADGDIAELHAQRQVRFGLGAVPRGDERGGGRRHRRHRRRGRRRDEARPDKQPVRRLRGERGHNPRQRRVRSRRTSSPGSATLWPASSRRRRGRFSTGDRYTLTGGVARIGAAQRAS